MKSIEAHKKLLDLNQPVIKTVDAAACLNTNITTASKILARLRDAKLINKILRNLWSLDLNLDPLTLPEYLTFPLPSYISMQTALFYHGMISQIPETIYVISLDRTKQYITPMGKISVHHIDPNLFFGFDVVENTNIKLASPEKALIDFFYLYSARSLLFRKLPELEIPKHFSKQKINLIINKISLDKRRVMVEAQLNKIFEIKKQ